jgi:hypothetical protein
MARLTRSLCLLLLLSLFALSASGCAAEGEDAEVIAAITATSKFETRAFTGSLKMQPLGKSKKLGGGTTTMKFDGAIDTTDDANARMLLKMDAGGSETSLVLPGDGRLYITAEGESHYIDVPAAKNKETAIDPAAIYAALLKSVGRFKPSPPLTNAAGQSVRTLSAKIDKQGLCGPLLSAFGETLSQTGGAGSGLGGLGGQASGMMQDFCKEMLTSDPRVWFGIDNGKATDVTLATEVKLPFAGEMRIEVIYHEFNQGGRQSGFTAPSGATPLPSPAAQLSGAGA